MAVLYTDDNGIPHVSEYDSDSKWKTRIIVDKRKLAIAVESYDQTLSVAAAAGTTISVTPAANELWRVKMLRLIFPAPVGATSGSHYTLISIGLAGTAYSLMRLDSDYNHSISIYNNAATADIMAPFDELTQFLVINSLVVTNAQPLRIYYGNSTDVSQTGNLTLRVTREVEYIGS
jgi:hypothetical protein